MKKLLLTLLMAAGVCAGATAQLTHAHPFTGPLAEDLTMTSYDADPEAEAVVIRELGDYYFLIKDTPRGYHFELYMVVTSKVKILTQAGIEYADIEVPYFYDNSDMSESVEIEGVTYNYENGQVIQTRLDQNNVFTENVGSNIRLKKAAMPNVKVGSVIETRYVINTTRLFSMRPWRFQKRIPVIHSMLQYRATPFYEYAFILKGAGAFDEFDSKAGDVEHSFYKYKYKDTIYKFVKNDLPAFRDEEFLFSTDDYMANLYFQMSKYYNGRSGANIDVASTWPRLCSDLRKDPGFGKYISTAEKSAKKLLAALDLDGRSGEEKIRIITDHVKAMYEWDGRYMLFAGSKVQEFLNDKRGNSADLNLFLIGMLKAAGLEAYPVALSTRSHGRIYKDYPFLQFLDCVIGVVEEGGRLYFVDATNQMGKFDEVSYQCANVEGLVITDREEGWMDIIQSDLATENNMVRITFEPDTGIANFETTSSYSGSKATSRRRSYNGDQSKLEQPLRSAAGVEVRKVEAANFASLSSPFYVQSDYGFRYGEPDADKIIINPLQYVAPSENPFKQTSRQHIIDMIYASVSNFVAEITVPEGYEIEYLGAAADATIPGASFSYYCSIVGDKIMVHATFKLRNVFDADEYLPLKEFYGELIDKFSDVVILAKSSGEEGI